MKKSLELLNVEFESSSRETPQFKFFYTTFKREFTKELKQMGATDIKFSKGHFYLSGFFTSQSGQPYYFSLSDLRGSVRKLLYRTAKDYKDYRGGSNMYVPIETGMFNNMEVS